MPSTSTRQTGPMKPWLESEALEAKAQKYAKGCPFQLYILKMGQTRRKLGNTMEAFPELAVLTTEIAAQLTL